MTPPAVSRSSSRPLALRLGVLGGMGPLASAELLGTLYRMNLREPEQEMPSCVLLSDPTFPDRTEAILAGATDPLVERLEQALQALLAQGADRIVIACVTIHHILPRVAEPLRDKVISLLDLIADEVIAAPRRRLLLTTIGTRAARIFESHPRWRQIERWVAFPGDQDQATLHDWIYRLKAGASGEGCLEWIASLAAPYGVEGFMFGCTELHLLHRLLGGRLPEALDVIDPLWTVARDVGELLRADPVGVAPLTELSTASFPRFGHLEGK